MSEQNLKSNPSNSDNVAADDPLAELARIVSGEESYMKPSPGKGTQSAPEVEVSAPAEMSMDLESQLLAELGIAQDTPDQNPIAVTATEAIAETVVDSAALANTEELDVVDDGLDFESAFEDQLGEVQLGSDQKWIAEENVQTASSSIVEPEVEAAVAELENAFASTPIELPEPIVAQASFGEEVTPSTIVVEVADITASIEPSITAADEIELEDAFADAFQNEMAIEETPVVEEFPFDNFEAAFEQQISDSADVLTHSDETEVSIDTGEIDAMLPEAVFAIEPELGELELEELELEVPEAQVIAPPAPKSSGGLKMAATALGMALVIGGGAIGYGYFKEGGNSGPPVLVRADKGDFKEKPKDAGGKKIANQNQPVYDNMAGKNAEAPKQAKLVKSSEKPVEIAVNIAKPGVEKSAERLATGNNSPRTDNSATAVIKPRKVKTVTVRADGTIVTSSGEKLAALPVVKPVTVAPVTPIKPAVQLAKTVTAAPAAKATRSVATPTPAPPNPAEIPLAKTFPVEDKKVIALAPAAKKVKVAPAVVAPKPVKVSPPKPAKVSLPKPVKVSPTAPVQSAVPPGSYVVQISSQRSKAAAEASYQNLKRRFAGLLGSKGREIKVAKIKNKGTFFRVRIPIGTKSAAAKFCGRYKSQGGSCFITK